MWNFRNNDSAFLLNFSNNLWPKWVKEKQFDCFIFRCLLFIKFWSFLIILAFFLLIYFLFEFQIFVKILVFICFIFLLHFLFFFILFLVFNSFLILFWIICATFFFAIVFILIKALQTNLWNSLMYKTKQKEKKMLLKI